MRKITPTGLSLAVLAASGWMAAAQAKDTKPMHHSGKMHASKDSGDAAVEDLNAQSLDAAKSGKPFTPSATPAPAKPMAKTGKMTHHHHMAMKKPAADAAPK